MGNKTFKGNPSLLVSREEGRDAISILGEKVEVWPKFCKCKGVKCIQCFIEGKIRCDPRFRRVY